MKIYRYEKADGGGPFCTKDGILRINKNITFENELLYGCNSIEQLFNWFKDYPALTVGCVIKIYEVPDDEVIVEDYQVLFPKKYTPIDEL